MDLEKIFGKIVVKNKQISDAIEYEKKNRITQLPYESGSEIYSDSSVKEIGMNILIGYLSSLLDISADPKINIDLDLTYETVKSLPNALAYLFVVGMNSGYTHEKNIEIVEKTLAAYLTLLAANEENSAIFVCRPENIRLGDTFDKFDWAGMQIKVGTVLLNVDLLKAVQGDVAFDGKEVRVIIDHAAEVYEMITGKNLRDFGIDDLIAQLS